jgi:hypothetical protein
MKEKEGLEVIIRDPELNPQCSHGPTILFSRKNGRKFFACSFDRSHSCFHLEFEQFEKNKEAIMATAVKYERESIPDLREHDEEERIFCATCKKFIISIQNHEFHSYKKIDDMSLQQPSLFLPQLDSDSSYAQYFFDNQSLEFFGHIFRELKLTKIICIGAPRLHDFVRSIGMDSILLDIDRRFEAFYREDFMHFNMLNNFFFNGATDEERFTNFLNNGSADGDETTQHCVFTDPPFAARTELLSQTLKEITYKYFALCRKRLPVFMIFPYFNESHVRKVMPEMDMMDFQVSYMNHYAFNENYKGRKEGSPIRVFSNVDQRIIKYPPQLANYRFCGSCRRFVSKSNLHCKICKCCPSKNGSSYRHCLRCVKCVKPTYIHCQECDRCVQAASHNCESYQSHQECGCCNQMGHVEKFCTLQNPLKKRKSGKNKLN